MAPVLPGTVVVFSLWAGQKYKRSFICKVITIITKMQYCHVRANVYTRKDDTNTKKKLQE